MPGSLLFFLVLKQSVMKMRLVAAVCALIVAHYFLLLFVCSTERRMMKARIPEPTSGHRDRSFFVRCPEVGLELSL